MDMKKEITVLFVLNTTSMGGGNISLINLIRELHNKGVLIHLAHPDNTINESFLERTKKIVNGYHVVRVYPQVFYKSDSFIGKARKNLKRISGINQLRLNREIKDLSKIVEEVKPDIIHTNSGVIHSGFFVAKKYNIPHVWHIREYQINDFGYEIYPSKDKFISYLKESYVITITRDILAFFDLCEYAKARCIYNGCFSSNDVSKILDKEKYFLCCSRISEEKGHDEIIKAFSIVHAKKPDYRLIIAGFGDRNYIEYLKDLSKELNCSDSIEFVGYQKDIRSYMDYALSLIVASRFEGFGRMTAEAAFRGCVVIGKNTGGTKEILDETGGFLYSKDYSELADAMLAVTELSQQQYSEIIEKAQNRAVELYSNEISANNVYDFYESILR